MQGEKRFVPKGAGAKLRPHPRHHSSYCGGHWGTSLLPFSKGGIVRDHLVVHTLHVWLEFVNKDLLINDTFFSCLVVVLKNFHSVVIEVRIFKQEFAPSSSCLVLFFLFGKFFIIFIFIFYSCAESATWHLEEGRKLYVQWLWLATRMVWQVKCNDASGNQLIINWIAFIYVGAFARECLGSLQSLILERDNLCCG